MKYLKKSLVILLLCSSLSLFGEIFYSKDYMPTSLKPNNTLFGVDIHYTLINRDSWKMAKIMVSEFGVTALYHFLRPSVRSYFYSDEMENLEWQDKIKTLAERFPELKPLISAAFHIDNSRTPIEGMPELIKWLHDKGYELDVFSNIHPNTYYGWHSSEVDASGKPAQSTPGLKDLMPEIFSNFASAQVGAKKPEPQAFANFVSQFNKDRLKKIIFIDDSKKNIKAAVENGIDIGILFESPDQLKEDLKSLGIK